MTESITGTNRVQPATADKQSDEEAHAGVDSIEIGAA